MTGNREQTWWDPNVPQTYDASKTKQLPYRDVWPFLRRLYDRYGAQRMVYANFFEYLVIKDLIPFFTAEDKEWILGKTAMKVYRITSGPRAGARATS